MLERAASLAESGADLPEEWLERVARIGASPSKTYIAALGTALLAKATDPRIDALAVKSKAGPTAYSMRGVVKVLVEKAPAYGYHLGVTRREPLNNQPWFGADRVDRFESVRIDQQPFHRDMVRYLADLNGRSAEDAALGLAAFIRVRTDVRRRTDAEATELRVSGGSSLEDIFEILQMFLAGDTEGGRLGQALVATVFDFIADDVRLAAINDPTSLDVAVYSDGRLTLGIEVKQKPVREADALGIAQEVARRGADKALLVAIALRQEPLDKERIRRQAEARSGVAVTVFDSLRDLVFLSAVYSRLSARDLSVAFPERYFTRMREHGVPNEGLAYWADLSQTLASAD